MNVEPESVANRLDLVVNLAGIIEIFGRTLYSEFGAIVRELVQNGHDGCLEDFAVANSSSTLSNYWVNVRYDSVARTLVLADNGIGMSRADVSVKLNDFAFRKKDDARDAVAAISPDQPLYIIGMYGVGFLSALAVSEEVDVWTRREGQTPIVWSYRQGQDFADVRDVSPEEFDAISKRHGLRAALEGGKGIGTVVICLVAAEVEEDYGVTPEVVRAALWRYVRLLRVPVFFNGERMNDQTIAWSNPAQASVEDWREAIREWTGAAPLLVIPLYSPPNNLDLEGVLWIPERKKILGDNGHIDVYIRRMFITRTTT
jgi:HSP90 family molecular chaperone